MRTQGSGDINKHFLDHSPRVGEPNFGVYNASRVGVTAFTQGSAPRRMKNNIQRDG